MLLNPNRFGFDPLGLSNLQWLFQSKLSSQITLNGSDVSNWEASNDAAIDAGQGTAARQPAYATNSVNGHNTVDFTQASDHRLQSGSLTNNIGAGDFYTWMAFKWTTNTAENCTIYTANGGSFQLFVSGDTDTFIFWTSAAGRQSLGDILPTLNQWHTYEVWRSGTTLTARRDGSTTQVNGGVGDNIGNSGLITLGDFDAGGGEVMGGSIYEIGLVGSLPSAADRDANIGRVKSEIGI